MDCALQNVGRQNNDSDCGAFVLQVRMPPLFEGLRQVDQWSSIQSGFLFYQVDLCFHQFFLVKEFMGGQKTLANFFDFSKVLPVGRSPDDFFTVATVV